MGRRRRNNKRKSTSRKISVLTYPLVYVVSVNGNYNTTISTISDTFDRRRPFRISGFRFEASADAKPFIIQFQAFGPVSASDNVWSSDMMLISQPLRRGSYIIPVSATQWYPSDAAVTSVVFRLTVTCEDKQRATSGLVLVYIEVSMGPREDDGTCPTVFVRANTVEDSG